MNKKFQFGSFMLFLGLFILSCDNTKTAQIWTDRPEVAIYAELFNTSQTSYKVSVKYYENPGQVLEKTGISTDIIIGSRVKNLRTGSYFRSLDGMFGANKLARSDFYPALLSIGRIDRNQYLLPVSFNLPSLIFAKERMSELSSTFTIGFDEIKTHSKKFNTATSGTYTRMGFSPLWNDEFLMTIAILNGASFREASPLAWDANALERSMEFVNNWTIEINTSNQAEEEFTFKYFIEPPARLIQNGRILFSYMDSRDFFTLNPDNRNNLDFRWIMERSQIPINEDLVFIGIPKRSRSTRAARAFIQWFFNINNQNLILNYCMDNKISDYIFGICDGFSSLVAVTEGIFPQFYPELPGRMPPSEYLLAPNILPSNWADLKQRVVLPYIHERSRTTNVSEITPLERRLSDWIRMNR